MGQGGAPPGACPRDERPWGVWFTRIIGKTEGGRLLHAAHDSLQRMRVSMIDLVPIGIHYIAIESTRSTSVFYCMTQL